MKKIMRNLKFRAWDDRKQRIEDNVSLDLQSGWWCYLDDDGHIIKVGSRDKSGPPIMQYTGLKDKNGKEIYEGDILRTHTNKDMVVSWSNKFASFVINRKNWAFCHWFGESGDPEDYEVIGNIYENPEIIKVNE